MANKTKCYRYDWNKTQYVECEPDLIPDLVFEEVPANECNCTSELIPNSPPFTLHRKGCKLYDLEKESVQIVNDLLTGMKDWSADCDGIHPYAWEAYKKGLAFVGDISGLVEAINSEKRDN